MITCLLKPDIVVEGDVLAVVAMRFHTSLNRVDLVVFRGGHVRARCADDGRVTLDIGDKKKKKTRTETPWVEFLSNNPKLTLPDFPAKRDSLL